MIRMFIFLGAMVLLTLPGLCQDPGNSTTAPTRWVSDGQVLTCQAQSWVRIPVQRVIEKRALTAADLAGIETYRLYWAKRGLSVTPSVRNGLELMLQMDVIHLPIYVQRPPQEIDLAYQIIDQLLKRVDCYVNVPSFQMPTLPPLRPVKVVYLACVPMPTVITKAACRPVKEVVTNCYTTTNTTTIMPAGYQARFPYQTPGPVYQGSLYVGVTLQHISNPGPPTPPTGPCDPGGNPNPGPPPGATNGPIGPVSGPPIVPCPLPPGSIPGNVPQNQPGFIPGGTGAGGSPSTAQ